VAGLATVLNMRSRKLGEREGVAWMVLTLLLIVGGLFSLWFLAPSDGASVSYPAVVAIVAVSAVIVGLVVAGGGDDDEAAETTRALPQKDGRGHGAWATRSKAAMPRSSEASSTQ
jgi:hypothetical protein